MNAHKQGLTVSVLVSCLNQDKTAFGIKFCLIAYNQRLFGTFSKNKNSRNYGLPIR